jgi:hypothetical protein
MANKPKVSERRIRQILSAILAALLIISISYLGVKYFNASKAATTANTIFVTPAQASWTQGQNVSVTVTEDSGQTPTSGAQFVLNYNAAQLQYTGLSESGQFDFVAPQAPTCTPLNSCKTNPGTLQIMRGMKAPSNPSSPPTTVTGVHAMVTLNFKVLAATGTANITLDQANSIIARSPDGGNVLTGVSNGSFTIVPAIVQDAVFSLTPSSGSYNVGSNIDLILHLKSPTQQIFASHAVVTFPNNLVQYVSTDTAGDPFSSEVQTTPGTGTLDLVRGVGFGSGGFMGNDAVVAVMHFKVTGSSGSIPFGIRRASGSQDSGAYDTNGKNLLGAVNASNLTIQSSPPTGGGGGTTGGGGGTTGGGGGTTGGGGGTTGGGGGTTGGGGGGTTNPPAGGGTTNTTKAPVYSGSTAFKATTGGNVTLSGNDTQLQGAVELAPLADAEILAQNPGDSIVRVEYYLGKKLVNTQNSAPFSYTFDSKKLRNGTYDMTIKTYYKSGAVDSQAQKLVVKNPVTISYVMVHYGTGIIGSIAGLIIVAFLLWRFVWPRFSGNNPAYGFTGGGYDGPDAASTYDPYAAPSAAIISPSAIIDDTAAIEPTLPAADTVQPLPMENPQTVAATPPEQPAAPAPTPIQSTPPASPRPAAPQTPAAEQQPPSNTPTIPPAE